MPRIRLHRDDTPGALAILHTLLGAREDHEFIGYAPDAWGAEVDWARLGSGVLSTTELAVIHIAHGCALVEAHGGGLPRSVRHAVRIGLDELTGPDTAARHHEPATTQSRVMPLV